MKSDPEVEVELSGIILNGKNVLFGERINPQRGITYGFPSKKLRARETFEIGLYRDIEEETGLKVQIIDKTPCAVTNDLFQDEHYVTLFFRSQYIGGKTKNTESEKWKGWHWFRWDRHPSPLYLPIQNLIKQEYDPFKI